MKNIVSFSWSARGLISAAVFAIVGAVLFALTSALFQLKIPAIFVVVFLVVAVFSASSIRSKVR